MKEQLHTIAEYEAKFTIERQSQSENRSEIIQKPEPRKYTAENLDELHLNLEKQFGKE
jgi:hypothetical protein